MPTIDRLNESLKTWFSIVSTEKGDQVLGMTHGFVHAKDISKAHVLALTKEKAGGQRIIVAGGNISGHLHV